MDEPLSRDLRLRPDSPHWWRFGEYEIVDDAIRPKAGAKADPYDPWEAYDERLTAGGEFPFQELIKWANDVDITKTGEAMLGSRTRSRMLRWCRDNGLLGLLHHELIAVETRARWEHSDRGTPVAVVRGYRRTGFGWRATAREIEGVVPPKDVAEGEELSAEVVRAGVPAVTSTLPIWMVMRMGNGLAERVAPFGDLVVLRRALVAGGDFTIQRLSGEWIDYFDPDAPLRYPSWPLPAPDSEDFWRQYSEPLTDFMVNAWTLGHALKMLERQNPDHKPLPDEKRDIEEAWSVINSLASAVAPMGRYVSGRHHLGWSSPSLLGSYAAMILSRLAGGAEIRICPACRSPFTSTDRAQFYCSTSCRETAKKRRQRAARR